MQQQAAFLNRLLRLALDPCHMRVYISPQTARGLVSPISAFYWFVPRCLILQGLHVRTGSGRIQGNQRENVGAKESPPSKSLPTNVVRQRGRGAGSRLFLKINPSRVAVPL